MLGRGFTPAEVKVLDEACDLAEAAVKPAEVKPARPAPVMPSPAAVAMLAGARLAPELGSLSEEYESGGRGPGTVSGGVNDPGGVSYGTYQLASKTGTCSAFVKMEGKPWAAELAASRPGSAAFSAAWKAIAEREPEAFRKAQHAFIERTHYRPVVTAVEDRKAIDLNARSEAVRNMVWSCAVQHRGAPNILIQAVDMVDRSTARCAPDYDRKLIEAGYEARTAYVLAVAGNPKLPKGERDLLVSITKNRFVKERVKALAMLNAAAQTATNPVPATIGAAAATIDGNVVAAAHGVGVKSAAVKISNLHPKMEAAIIAVAAAAKSLNLPKPVITSGNDSAHSSDSLHYKGRALDFRGNNIAISVGEKFCAEVAARLGDDYDVLFEVFMNAANNHLHVEYDPD
jgi:hypothetical protein